MRDYSVFNGKKVLVVGLAKSGIAASEVLAQMGAEVTINDSKPESELGDSLQNLKQYSSVTFCLGQPAMPLVEGKDMLVISPGIPDTAPFVKKAYELGIRVIGELELGYETLRGKVVAITGTNGKTTTTTLTGEIFKAAGKRTFVTGNIGIPTCTISLQTRPDDMHVIEVSSFQLETVREFHPRASAILNVTEDHLNRHGTMQEYIRMKERIFENQTGDDLVVLNWDDPVTREIGSLPRCKVAFFSRKEKVSFGSYVENEQVLYKPLEGAAVPVIPVAEIRIPGTHNLENALAAVTLTMACGVPAETVRETLKTFAGVEHRIEFVRTVNGISYINDSKGTNVDSTLKAIDTMKAPTVIILGGSEKNSDYLPLARAMMDSCIVGCVTIGDTAGEIEEALQKAGYTNYVPAGHDFRKAIETAAAMCPKNGTVLLSPACASFDMFEDFEQRGEIFKEIVNSL